MNLIFTGILACLLYLASAGIQLKEQPKSRKPLVLGLGYAGLLLHAYTTWAEIFTQTGINMGLLPMVSLMFLAVVAMILLSSLRRPVENLLIVLFPLAAVALGLSLMFHETYTPRLQLAAGFVAHIILSVVAYSLLTIAAFQAILLSFGDYELRHHRLAMLKRLPPLQTMEGLLFELIWGGLLFLSLSIGTGFFYLGTKEAAVPGLVHHTVITFAAWVVFAILLWGRYQLGWRGAVASRWTLSGFALLVLGYFGSKFVIEVILGRA